MIPSWKPKNGGHTKEGETQMSLQMSKGEITVKERRKGNIFEILDIYIQWINLKRPISKSLDGNFLTLVCDSKCSVLDD